MGTVLRDLSLLLAAASAVIDAQTPAVATWVQQSPQTSPPGTGNYGMAFDSAHGQFVLYSYPSTWVWDSSNPNWIKRSPQANPQVADAVVVFDSVHKQIVLAGTDPTGSFVTWVWDGVNWTQKAPKTSPPPRRAFAMAFDSARGQAVLFGGAHPDPYSASVNSNDTWVWDGENWNRKFPETSPQARHSFAMAYDSARGQVVLFSGSVADTNNRGAPSPGDTWVWNGGNWTPKAPKSSPGPRDSSVMANDSVRNQIVLFGGSGNRGDLNDTWAWDGSNWSQSAIQNSPPVRSGAAMAYGCGQFLLFGGFSLSAPQLYLSDTWTMGTPGCPLTPPSQIPKTLSISSGDPQTAATGAAVAVAAKVTDMAGLPVVGAKVTFTVTSGTAEIASAVVNTVGDGTATAQVTMGTAPGQVTIRADSSGLAPVTFTINVVPPFINPANGVIGLPMSTPPVMALSENALMQISGQGFVALGQGGTVGDGDLVNGSLPASFRGVCVSLSGAAAPLMAVNPTQIIFQVPVLPLGGTADVSVTTACGSGQDLQTAAVTLPVQATAPEFFYIARNADGTALVAARNNATGQPAFSSQPGDSVTVYLTGLGTTDSTNPGDIVSANVGVNTNVTLQLGAETITPDWVTTPSSVPGTSYIASIRENAGVYMIQFTIPSDAAPGNLPLIVTTGDGSTSPASAYLVIGQPASQSKVTQRVSNDGANQKNGFSGVGRRYQAR